MIRKYAEIFCWKNVSSFCTAKATHIFSAKNIRILYIESAKTLNKMTLNELVKLTMLWTTGPRTLTPCHTCSKIWTSTIYYMLYCLKIAGWVEKRVDPDEMPHSVVSHLGLHCLLRPACLNTYDKYGTKETSEVYCGNNLVLINTHTHTHTHTHSHRGSIQSSPLQDNSLPATVAKFEFLFSVTIFEKMSYSSKFPSSHIWPYMHMKELTLWGFCM